jgi:uncharacterized protein YdhG (YjbR/CyaY superfamily)
VRRRILRAAPRAEECISYSLPAFRIDGRVVAGLGAFSRHLSYLPHSGSVLETMAAELGGRPRTKAALHFTVGQPLPARLVRRLIDVRLAEPR